MTEQAFGEEYDCNFRTSSGAVVWERAWAEPRYDPHDEAMDRSVIARSLSYDTASKDKEHNAYSACVVGELLPDYRMRLRHVWRDRLLMPDLVERIEADGVTWDDDGLLHEAIIEDRASGIGAYQTLMATGSDRLRTALRAFNPTSSKDERFGNAGVWVKNGSFILPLPCACALAARLRGRGLRGDRVRGPARRRRPAHPLEGALPGAGLPVAARCGRVSVLSGIRRFFDGSATSVNGSAVDYRPGLARATEAPELSYRDLCDVLGAFYWNNGLYETLRAQRFGLAASAPNIKPIRNPVPAAIDFWGAHGFPNPLRVVTPAMQQRPPDEQPPAATDPLAVAIEQVWAWSNWQRRMPECARTTGLYGESYLKVAADRERGRVWFELIEPRYVWDYEADERDYLTWLRLDVPKCETNYETGERRRYTRTEVWSKDEGTYRIWEADGDAYGRPLNSLGATADEGTLAELGIDFLPFVRIPFRELGTKRGIGAVQLAIEAIVEADLAATNLHEMLYQDAEGAWVLKAVGVDAAGRPLPAPVVQKAATQTDAYGRVLAGTGQAADGSVSVGKRSSGVWAATRSCNRSSRPSTTTRRSPSSRTTTPTWRS
jgi:hypothetical protein